MTNEEMQALTAAFSAVHQKQPATGFEGVCAEAAKNLSQRTGVVVMPQHVAQAVYIYTQQAGARRRGR